MMKSALWLNVPSPFNLASLLSSPHSKGPLIHNAMLKAANIDGVYVPFLVNDLPRFLKAAAASGMDLGGLSVTIPHKVDGGWCGGTGAGGELGHIL